MSGVLLLNASWEPLRVINLHRAIILVLQEKAEIVETGDGEVRSTGEFSVPYPEVIRLRYYVKIPYRSKVPLSNRAVLNRDRYRCAYCEGKATTVDHIVPKALGGRHEWTNVVAACKRCNQKKSNKTLEELKPLNPELWTLKNKPVVPTAKTWIVVANPSKIDAWADWLQFAT